ncbi:MAG: hypothetical protein ACTSPX_05145 [Candidatus Thorarchaeota archaeon]
MHTEQRNLPDSSELQRRTHAIVQRATAHIEASSDGEAVLYQAVGNLVRFQEIEISSVMAMIAAEAAGIGRQRATDVASAVLLVKRAADVHMLADVASVSDRLSQATGLVKLAILGGDLLMAVATRIIAKYGNPKSMSHLSRGLMCLLRDGARRNQDNMPELFQLDVDTHIQSIVDGPGSYVGESAVVGALAGGVGGEMVERLRDFATLVGVAWYLRSCVTDMEEILLSATRGTLQTSDVTNETTVIPLVLALRSCPAGEAETIVANLARGGTQRALSIAQRYGAAHHTLTLASEYFGRARSLALESRERYLLRVAEMLNIGFS